MKLAISHAGLSFRGRQLLILLLLALVPLGCGLGIALYTLRHEVLSDAVQRLQTVADLKVAFHEAVDDYIATCARIGKAPQRPYSGKVMFRIDPDIHRRAATARRRHDIERLRHATGESGLAAGA